MSQGDSLTSFSQVNLSPASLLGKPLPSLPSPASNELTLCFYQHRGLRIIKILKVIQSNFPPPSRHPVSNRNILPLAKPFQRRKILPFESFPILLIWNLPSLNFHPEILVPPFEPTDGINTLMGRYSGILVTAIAALLWTSSLCKTPFKMSLRMKPDTPDVAQVAEHTRTVIFLLWLNFWKCSPSCSSFFGNRI